MNSIPTWRVLGLGVEMVNLEVEDVDLEGKLPLACPRLIQSGTLLATPDWWLCPNPRQPLVVLEPSRNRIWECCWAFPSLFQHWKSQPAVIIIKNNWNFWNRRFYFCKIILWAWPWQAKWCLWWWWWCGNNWSILVIQEMTRQKLTQT